jgi:hypothetical protein
VKSSEADTLLTLSSRSPNGHYGRSVTRKLVVVEPPAPKAKTTKKSAVRR